LKRFKLVWGRLIDAVKTLFGHGRSVSLKPSRPRLADVAAEAGVSAATASLVLRGKPGPGPDTRDAVLKSAASLGYRPDRSASILARRRSHVIGVTMDVSSAFHAELLEDIQASADARGYDIVVSPVTRRRGELRAVETLLDSRCEGLVLLGSTLPDDVLAELARGTAVVAVGRRADVSGVDRVRAADDRGVALAVEHLVSLGHRDIAFVDGPPSPIAALRRQGYHRAMRRAGCSATLRVVRGGDTEAAGASAARSLAGALPTAVIAFNDRTALGVLDQLRRNGVDVPAQVSVVGYDDSPVARLGTVDLTSVSQASEVMGEASVAAVVDRLEGRAPTTRDVVLNPHLVLRSTTGPAPTSASRDSNPEPAAQEDGARRPSR
jgi:DNA-binding LacI/PurR family transcriptional regulator